MTRRGVGGPQLAVFQLWGMLCVLFLLIHIPGIGICGALRIGAPFTPFWQRRYYDHNVRTHSSFVEKLRDIHRNPVKRGLCATPLDWKWSSYRRYATAEIGIVEIESEWTASRRNGREPQLLALSDEVKIPTYSNGGDM